VKAKREGSMFFFEKKNQKTFPGCFARIVGVGRMKSAGRMPAALKSWLTGAASCEAPGKSFLVLFFKKELLPSCLP
jgi:hypothetical protein